jgi:hypothetical protein
MTRKKASDAAIDDPTDPEGTLRPDLDPIQETAPVFTPVQLNFKLANPIIHLSAQQALDPLYIFSQFFPDWLLTTFVSFTNRFARIGVNQLIIETKACGSSLPIAWKDTSLEELKTFLAIKIYMAEHIEKEIFDYWKDSPEEPKHPTLKAKMKKNRFVQLTRYFHIGDVEKGPAGPYPKVSVEC